MPGKHHYFLAKHIKDAIVKHRVEIIFGRAESQISSTTVSAIIVCHAKTNDIRIWINHDVFIYFFCFSFLINWCNEKFILVVFFKGKNFSLQLNNFFIYVYSPTESGNFTYFLKESSHYTHFLANVLNNLPDNLILHFKIDVM